VNVIIETPRGTGNKYAYDPASKMFKLNEIMPLGMKFPFDFGFVPGTKAEDGDPLDVLVLLDEPAFTGCLVKCRVIGAMEAKQTEEGKTFRNDRLVAVWIQTRMHESIKSVGDLDQTITKEIEE